MRFQSLILSIASVVRVALMSSAFITPALAEVIQPEVDRLSLACLEQVNQGQFREAETACQQAANQTRGNRTLEAYSLGNLGTAYLQQNQHR